MKAITRVWDPGARPTSSCMPCLPVYSLSASIAVQVFLCAVRIRRMFTNAPDATLMRLPVFIRISCFPFFVKLPFRVFHHASSSALLL